MYYAKQIDKSKQDAPRGGRVVVVTSTVVSEPVTVVVCNVYISNENLGANRTKEGKYFIEGGGTGAKRRPDHLYLNKSLFTVCTLIPIFRPSCYIANRLYLGSPACRF
jgi:hypothetical protein